jgi:hypothetical protein
MNGAFYRIMGLRLVFVMALAVSGVSVEAQSQPQSRQAACFGTRDLTSPDGALQARITRVGGSGCGESRVELFESDGHFLLSADHTSYHNDNGEGVSKAAWTADSRYFIYSLVASDSHRSKRVWINVYSRNGNKIKSLDNVTIVDPDFTLGEGDFIELRGNDGSAIRIDLGA